MALSAFYLALLLGKAALAVARARKESAERVPEAGAGAFTVLQAVLSGDTGLREALEKNLVSLPRQHFLWLIDEGDAEAARVAEGLQAEHPGVSITALACPPCPDGANPKLFKLDLARPLVRTPFVLVLDDDTYLPARSADALIHHAAGA